MESETSNHGSTRPVKPVIHRRDATYQFPVYRWLSWLVIAGFAVGLGAMYLIAGMFGIPAPIGWAFLVVLFCAGIALLDRPRQLLRFMMFYFLLIPTNRLFGLLVLPLPGFLDELFFVPFIAVIAMSCIQRQELPKGLWFPMVFMGMAALSWYVNGKPAPFTAVQVTLIMLKFFIVWYFCRLTSAFEDMGQFWKWGEFYIYYAAAQFLYNCLWQRAPWVTTHPDHSGGVFGPDKMSSHFVGYISILALFLLAAWWMGEAKNATKRKRLWMGLMGVVITWDLLVMTDTKHGVLLMPFAFFPILFHERIPVKLRGGLLAAGGLVTVVGYLYLTVVVHAGITSWVRFGRYFADSPKGEAYLAVTRDFHYLVAYPVLGAGPGRFFSGQAADARAPLARRYVVPYKDEIARSSLMHGVSSRTGGGSMLMFPQSDLLTLMGEFGWLGMVVYAGFIIWVVSGLWRRANEHKDIGRAAVYLVLDAGVIFLSLIMFFAPITTVACVMFPWWMLVGRMWDMPVAAKDDLLPEPRFSAKATALAGDSGFT
jgi:hypothetical protein